jgi:hypothetical protein
MSQVERDALLAEHYSYGDKLRKNGHLIREEALEQGRNAATLRFQDGKVSITDGPFTETKEQLGGIMVLEASDLNHAIRLMSELPCMRVGGSLEIRPMNEELNAATTRRAEKR